LAEAFGHRSYVLLLLGFFTCGFQLAFVTVHLPSYLVDRGLSVEVGGWTLAIIGLFNIVGSLGSGYLATIMPKRYILSVIYFVRALSIVAFIMLPASPVATLIFGAVTGLLWLSTVPPTSGLVALMFGTRWLTMLFGFAFFSHQVGGFLGVWLGASCSSAPAPTTRSGGFQCCSACCRPSSTCRSSKSLYGGLRRRRPDQHTAGMQSPAVKRRAAD